jgi:hypothetical protein
MGWRQAAAMRMQIRESELFTIEDRESGRLLVAGGFWPWPDTPYEECWMLTHRGTRLPARAVVEGVSGLLLTRPAGRIPVAWIALDRPRDRRFAEFLGFKSERLPTETILGRQHQLMLWSPDERIIRIEAEAQQGAGSDAGARAPVSPPRAQ